MNTIDRAEFVRRASESARRYDADPDAQLASLDIIRLSSLLVQKSERDIHRPAGMSWSSFSVLWALHILGPLEARSLANVTGITKQAISQVVISLEAREVVRRYPDETGDRRLRTIALTDSGRTLAESLTEQQSTITSAWLSVLSHGERRILVELLEQLVATPWPVQASSSAEDSRG